MSISNQTDQRAFVLGILNGALWAVVTATIQPELVLSAFLLQLKDSVILATLPLAIMRLGQFLSHLVISNIAETWTHKKPFYIGGGLFRVLILALIALSTYHLGTTAPTLLVWIFMILLGLYAAGIGSSSIGFNEIIAKTISIGQRGQLMGLRGFFGGIVGIASGFYIRHILGGNGLVFPHNYAVLYTTAAFFLACCLLSFGFVYEPAGLAYLKRIPIQQHIQRGIGIFKIDANFRFLYMSNLVQAMALVGPVVYASFAIQILSIRPAFLGNLVILSAGLTLPINFLWSYIGDRYGNRLLIIVNTFLFSVSPLLVLVSTYLVRSLSATIGWETQLGFITPALACLILAHAIFTTTNGGFMIGRMNYLLEIAPEDRRPSYIAFMDMMLAPTAIFPLLGGFIAERISFQTNFLISILFGLLTLYYAYRLGEPRNKQLYKCSNSDPPGSAP